MADSDTFQENEDPGWVGPNMPDEDLPTPHPHSKTRGRWAEVDALPSMSGASLSFGEGVSMRANGKVDGWFEMLECLGISAERVGELRTGLNSHAMSVDGCAELLQSEMGGRLLLLAQLNGSGFTLRERQNLTNTFSRGVRAVGSRNEDVAHTILLQVSGFDAPSEAASMIAWGQQLDGDSSDKDAAEPVSALCDSRTRSLW